MNRSRTDIRSSLLRPSTASLAWTTLALNVVVILQGALVRATGSGAGCGRHWPACNGTVVPFGHGAEAIVEFSHRLLSGGALLLGAWLLLRAWRLRRERPGLRAFAALSFGFLIVEALLGAATVLLGLTGDNVSTARGVMVSVHLVNSLLLVGALAGTVVYARDGAPRWPLEPGRHPGLSALLAFGLVGMLGLMFSGGIAALGDTMFPSASLAEGLAADFDPASHPLVRLRVLHPLIAVTVGLYLFLSLGLAWWIKPVPQARRLAQLLFSVYLLQLFVGAVNLAFLAPLALQLLHLGMAVLAYGLLSAVAISALGYPAVARRDQTAPVPLENA